MISGSVGDPSLRDALIAQLNDEQLDRGELRVTETMINQTFRSQILGGIPGGMVRDYRISFRNGSIGVQLAGAAMGMRFGATYGLRVTSFDFRTGTHRLSASYTESVQGVPRLLYAKYGTLLRMMASRAPGVTATANTLTADLDGIAEFRSLLAGEKQLGELTLTLGSIEDGCLTLRFKQA